MSHIQQADAMPLSGLRVLVVEDAFLIAEDLADQLSMWGCEVIGPDGHVSRALEQIGDNELDGALLDVNLKNETSFPIASALAARGIPFVFLTGYDSDTVFPNEFRSSPKIGKPVDPELLARVMEQHFKRASHT
ncbi:hypothetical protein [Mesorhizobium sp. WSM2239]|uniref:Response regulatory domain-containing protein n=2 Tax=unclassified Mesorhizobium TaxID=325217 RepID=A0AAU8DFB1_9HYPH